MALPDNPEAFALEWIEAWNGHDLERILSHYAEDVVFTSPIAARFFGIPDGTLRGRDALRAYFGKGLSAIPDLQFRLQAITLALSSVSLVYLNQAGRMAVEMMELGADQRVVRAVVSYGDPIPPAPGAA